MKNKKLIAFISAVCMSLTAMPMVSFAAEDISDYDISGISEVTDAVSGADDTATVSVEDSIPDYALEVDGGLYAATITWPATSGIKTYCKSTSNNTKVFKTATSTDGKYGTIYATDLITITGYDKSSKRYKVSYQITTSGGTKSGYVAAADITGATYNVAKSTYTATAKTTTYRRTGGGTELGYISKGDKVYVITSTSEKYAQVIYPLSSNGGYKMGWIKSTDIPSASATVSPTATPVVNSKSKSLADVASGEVGYQGRDKSGKGTGDYTKYGEWMKYNGVSWCAEFVSWCVNEASVSTKIVPKTALCDTMKNNSNSYHIWSSTALKSIKKNDVIFFANSSKASHSDHVGIVYSVSGSKITVIEGNTGNYYGPDTVAKITYTVDSSTGKITKGYSGKYFCGYISVN